MVAYLNFMFLGAKTFFPTILDEQMPFYIQCNESFVHSVYEVECLNSHRISRFNDRELQHITDCQLQFAKCLLIVIARAELTIDTVHLSLLAAHLAGRINAGDKKTLK